jgi:PEGA domain-containing protein
VIPRNRFFTFVPVCIAAAGLLWPVDAAAQRRVVRRAPVRTVIVAGYGRPYYPYYYNPFFFDWYGGYGYQYRPYPAYPPYYYQPGSDLRIQVTPRDAQVYIDGYLAGTVDDFDGVFQRLRVPYGEHEVSIYREGYRTITEKMLFRPYESYHIKQPMQPLGAGETAEAQPQPDPNRRAPEPRGMGPGPRRPAPPDEGMGQAPPPRRGAPPEGRSADRNADRFGSVAIRVQPADAAVFIDGERWDTTPGEDRLLVELSEGEHRVEIRKEGFKTYSSTVRVRTGDTVPLNVSLSAGN